MAGVEWSKGIASFVRQNTGEIIITLVATLWFEHIGIRESKIQDRKKREIIEGLLSRSLDTSPPQALIHHCLHELIGNPGASLVHRQLFPNLPVLENVDVTLRASRHNTSGYSIELQISYECESNDFLVGLTDEPTCAETLMAMRFINEIRVVPRGTLGNFTEPENLPIIVDTIRKNANGSESIDRMKFKRLTNKRIKRILNENQDLIDESKFIIFEGDKKTNSHSGARYIIKSAQVNSINEPYMFWLTDRITHLRTINIDTEHLTENEKKFTEVIFFMGNIDWASKIRRAESRKTFSLDTWLLNGQGIAVFWPSLD